MFGTLAADDDPDHSKNWNSDQCNTHYCRRVQGYAGNCAPNRTDGDNSAYPVSTSGISGHNAETFGFMAYAMRLLGLNHRHDAIGTVRDDVIKLLERTRRW